MKLENKSLLFALLITSHCLLATLIQAAPEKLQRSRRSAGNANAYIDQVLANLRKELKHKHDPFSLPDKETGFSKKVLFIRIKGGAKFTSGKVYGLSTIRRVSTATLKEHHGTISIETSLGLNLISASYNYRAWLKPIKVSGKAHASIKNVRADIKVSIKPGSKPNLDKFELKLGKIRLNITGLGPITWTLSKLTNVISNLIRGRIANRIEGPVRKELQKVLHKSNFVL